MPFQFVVAGLLFASIQPLPLLAFTNPQLVSQLSPKPFTSQMEVFNRELDRAEQLYDNVMFEEGDRVADMTIARINGFLAANATIEGVDEIENVYKMVYDKKVLPSMRSLQFAGKPIDINNSRIFNCSYLPIDDWRAFSEVMFLLLAIALIEEAAASKSLSRFFIQPIIYLYVLFSLISISKHL